VRDMTPNRNAGCQFTQHLGKGDGDIQTFSLVLTIWADLQDDDRFVTLAAS